jgi:hypothetical protein
MLERDKAGQRFIPADRWVDADSALEQKKLEATRTRNVS